MPFTSEIEVRGAVALIKLTGELDAASAVQFRTHVEQAAAAQVSRLVLLMQELEYMASAGLRALVFAKQKMGEGVDIYMIGVQDSIVDTLKMTGFYNSVILQDSYDEADI